MKLKQQLIESCQQFVNKKLSLIENNIQSYKDDLEGESKSTAGDKHETGRAMLHIEMEKAAQQFESLSEMRQLLNRIRPEKSEGQIKLGSLVTTDKGIYFISISAGQLPIDDQMYWAVSSASPVGQKMLGRRQGDTIALGPMKLFDKICSLTGLPTTGQIVAAIV